MSFALTELDVGNTLVLPARVVGCSQLPVQTETDIGSEEAPSFLVLSRLALRCALPLSIWEVGSMESFLLSRSCPYGEFSLAELGTKNCSGGGGVGVVPPLPHNADNFFDHISMEYNIEPNLILPGRIVYKRAITCRAEFVSSV